MLRPGSISQQESKEDVLIERQKLLKHSPDQLKNSDLLWEEKQSDIIQNRDMERDSLSQSSKRLDSLFSMQDLLEFQLIGEDRIQIMKLYKQMSPD